jgi:hypothetical protein
VSLFSKDRADKTDELVERKTPILEAFMAKTLALFFVLGLMVSCASYHNERTISSVDKAEKEAGYRYERGMNYR